MGSYFVLDPIVFHYMDKNVIVNIYFYILQNKESNTGLEKHEGE